MVLLSLKVRETKETAATSAWKKSAFQTELLQKKTECSLSDVGMVVSVPGALGVFLHLWHALKCIISRILITSPHFYK